MVHAHHDRKIGTQRILNVAPKASQLERMKDNREKLCGEIQEAKVP